MISTIHDYIGYMKAHYDGCTAFQWVEDETEAVQNRTYNDYVRDIRKFASYLTATMPDIRGKHIAILSANNYHYAVGVFGIMLSGAVAILVNASETWEIIRDQLALSDTTCVFCDAQWMQTAQKDETLTVQNLGAYEAQEKILDVADEDDGGMCLMLFTSGTTGRCKGVMISRNGIFESFRGMIAMMEHTIQQHGGATEITAKQTNAMPSMRGLFVHQMYHAAGMTTIVAYGLFGFCANLCPSLKYIYRDLKLMPSGRTSAVPIIAEMFYKDLRRGKREKLGALKEISCGAAKIDEQVLKTFHDNGFIISQGYALTETFAGGTINPYTDIRKIASVGKPNAGCEVKIVDGEVCMRISSVMLGYYNNPEATAEAIRDGWLYTGDLGYLDEDGYLYLTGRKKNLIILSGGENVSPEELEGLLLAHDEVLETVVKEKDGKICACVYCEPKDQDNVRKIISMVNQTLPTFKHMTMVEFRDEPFPRTGTGKILRH